MTELLDCCWQGKVTGLNKKIVKAGQFIVNRRDYTRFKVDLAWLFVAKRLASKTWKNGVSVSIYLWTNYDIDSFIKPILDAAQMAKIFVNDKQVSTLIVEKLPKATDDCIQVVIFGLEK